MMLLLALAVLVATEPTFDGPEILAFDSPVASAAVTEDLLLTLLFRTIEDHDMLVRTYEFASRRESKRKAQFGRIRTMA
jgi:hypothetical protein